MSGLVDDARERAEAGLLANAGPLGLLASAQAYQQVWCRDAMISALGLLAMADDAGAEVYRRSADTLVRHQSPLGNLPHNVGVPGVRDPALVAEGGRAPAAGTASVVVDTAHAGTIDGALWFILAVHHAWTVTGDLGELRGRLPAIARAYRWLTYQDANECGLLEAHEAADWADLFANRYNSLGPNVLWYAVHRALERISEAIGPDPHLAEAAVYGAGADDIRFKLNTLLWVGPEFRRDLTWVRRHRREWLYPIQVTDHVLQERPYYLPYVAFRDWADRFDAFGNLLAIVFGVADRRQADRILGFVEASGVAEPWPVCAITPVVHPGDRDWREYYRLRNLNLPHQYHNGGAWPFLGGFYVAALVRAGRTSDAATVLHRLAEMNACGSDGVRWGFHEWFHGTSGRPMGFAGQSWSMAMYAYAHAAITGGRCPGLSDPVWALREPVEG
jgi:glycogen debranching enzyme